MNFAYSGDKIQNCLYRVLFGKIPTEARNTIIHIGTNNLSRRDSPTKVAKGILMICSDVS